MLLTNVVGKEKLREVQTETLKLIKECLICSFGPVGSNTEIVKDKQLTRYSKDGYTILQNIQFFNTIEESVRQELVGITEHIAKTIGDGTTSAVVLSAIIFEKLKELEKDYTPYELINALTNVINSVKTKIKENAREFNSDIAYNISLISTNGNKEVAQNIKDIYDQFGNDVFISLSTSTGIETYLKTFDGLNLGVGYSDTAYVNNSKKGVCNIPNARIYAFQDPIDTIEMIGFFNKIIDDNILTPASTDGKYIPTVILTPKLSRDMGTRMEKLIDFMYANNGEDKEQNKPPLLVINGIYQTDQYLDIARLCGCKIIRKYIDLKQQQEDQNNGNAPTLETVSKFNGFADIVEADTNSTKFINPANMLDENGEPSIVYKNQVKFLEDALKKAIAEGENANTIGSIRRRLNSLKANMVEYIVGGISVADRDSLKDLIEDAVKNCRSASINGYGYGANFEALMAINKLISQSTTFGTNEATNGDKILDILHSAYNELVLTLYNTCMSREVAEDTVNKCLEYNKPYNIRDKEYSDNVICSIDTDIIIANAVSKIVSIMFTCNQFLCPDIPRNRYIGELKF